MTNGVSRAGWSLRGLAGWMVGRLVWVGVKAPAVTDWRSRYLLSEFNFGRPLRQSESGEHRRDQVRLAARRIRRCQAGTP